MYAKIETERLNFIRNHQNKLRADKYIHLKDTVGRQDVDADQLGKLVILPSYFTGGPRYMHERAQDALTYVRHYGSSDLFVTFTCNPKWQEIQEALLRGQKHYHRPDIIARVFNRKVKELIDLLTKGDSFGKVRRHIYSVEWQKRGLPHVHILLWLENQITSDMIDKFVCAEIPNPDVDPLLYEIVKANMIHGPCGLLNKNSPCMKGGVCSKRYPVTLIQETQRGEDGYPKYRRRSTNDGGFKCSYKCRNNQFNQSIKYVCKYVTKGSDHAAFGLGKSDHTDEIKYMKVAANNVAERIENPPTTTLQAFFQICQTDNFARTLLYPQVASYYVWKNKNFVKLKQGQNVEGWPGVKKDTALGRVYTIHPNNVECYHLRLLLHYVKGPTSYSFLKIVNNIEYPTFQATCKALGLLEDDNQWDFALEEAALCRSPNKMRELFSTLFESRWNNLKEYGLPTPTRSGGLLENREYLKETSYDLNALQELFYAPGGTGKTHLINILLAKVRGSYGIAIAAASSGIAATLLHGGKTAHSAFKLPLNLNTIEIPT
ncbi:uncharacterized protein LOC126551035 [Aphis gossypii]|uniref:uncharacterized protein LOC126551035 n=1 Tax=Aphis gossypii TaxID=80765 RepID=UPI002159862D|nr:uncharacterized protein LOC126551035 [Aphis gossypii]